MTRPATEVRPSNGLGEHSERLLTLGIDTSTNHGSIGLSDKSGPIAHGELHSTSNHVERLLPAIHELLSGAGLRAAALDLIAVTTGPGSFTGVRIGMATAKGLALATRRPLAGFSTLETMGLTAWRTLPGTTSTPVCVLLRAGREEVYRGLFTCEEFQVTSMLPEGVFSPAEAIEGIPEQCRLVGDGVELCAGERESREGWRLHPAIPVVGTTLALRAIDAAGRAAFERFPPLVPNYLRLSDAEVQFSRS